MNTISYTNGVSQIPLLGETIGENFRKTVNKYPTADALVSIHQNHKVDYKTFFNDTTKVAKSLIAIGISKGDRVGIWAPNCFEWTQLQFATARIGVILVNVNPAYRAHELEFVINQSELSVIFSAISYKSSDYKEMLSLVIEDCTSLKKIIYLNEEWDLFLQQGSKISDSELDIFEKSVQFDDPVNIQYTSGTTGFPKGVTLSHHNILNNGFFIGQRLNYTSKDRVCIPVPFYHCFGMVIGNIACVAHGACMIIPNDAFDPEKTTLAKVFF